MIRFTKVHRSFGTREALRSVSFTLHRGEVLGLLGHNGAGKTTALRLMATILTPTSGRIEVLDHDIEPSRDGRGFKARLGFLPDDPFLYPFLTGNEMLHFVGALHQLDPELVKARVRR